MISTTENSHMSNDMRVPGGKIPENFTVRKMFHIDLPDLAQIGLKILWLIAKKVGTLTDTWKNNSSNSSNIFVHHNPYDHLIID